MLAPVRQAFLLFFLLLLACNVNAQVDDICAESGEKPSLDQPSARVPYVYGRVVVKGYDDASNPPKVAVILSESHQGPQRLILGNTGNYCFRRKGTGAGSISIEVNGIEVAVKQIPTFGPAQVREDFEVSASSKDLIGPPGVVSAKLSHPINPATVDLYRKTTEAEAKKELEKAIGFVREIVLIDPEDFVAWAKLGSLYFETKEYSEAQKAFKRSLELKIEYVPAWVNLGKMRMAQKEFVAAIEIFKYTIKLEPKSARLYQLLGEAYLQNKQGTYGVQLLNKAIELDPVGMAECHLQLAHLYQLAKANNLATREYKAFLSKVPDHPDKAKFEKFIKENPE